jgi:hypothetical protein
VIDVDDGALSTRPDGSTVRQFDRARRMRSFLAILTVLAVIFLWVTVTVRLRRGRNPSVFVHDPVMEGIGCVMCYALALILSFGSAILWRTTAWPGCENPIARGRTVAMYAGWTAGIVLGLLFTALDLLMMGWVVFPQVLFGNLTLFPIAYLISVAMVFREPGKWPLRWGWPRVRIRALMALIAYLALLLGLVQTTARLGWRARSYQLKYDFYEGQISVWEAGARQTPAIAGFSRSVIEYYAPLAAKYERARKTPWIEVPPDPPLQLPGTGTPILLSP